MRMLILGAAIGATMLGALPASAEVVVRGPGAAVVVGEHHDDWRYRRHHSWRRAHADCRVVKVRTRLPNGDVIVKTRRSC